MVPFSLGPSTVSSTRVPLSTACGDLGVGEDADALLDEGFFQGVADLVVLDGQDARGHFDEGHLGAEGVVNVGELDADRARADDDHFLRLLGEDHRLLGADDAIAIERQAGQAAGFAAGGDEDVLGFEKLCGCRRCR